MTPSGRCSPRLRASSAHLVRRPQQHAAGDPPVGARDGGLDDPGLGALGQDQARVGGAGLLDQVVAESGGAEPARPGGAGQRVEPGRVQRIGDGVCDGLDPFQVVDRQSRVEVTHPRRGLVAAVVDDQDRQAGGAGGPGEVPHPRVRLGPDAEQQGGQPGSAELGEAGGHDHVVAIPGDDDEPAFSQHAEAARDALGEHRHLFDTPGQVTLAEHPRVQLADEVAHPQPGQLRTVRHRGEEPELALGQRVAQLRCRRRIRRRHAVDHTADHAFVLTRRVPAGRDGEPFGQTLSGIRSRGWPGLSRVRAPRVARRPPRRLPASRRPAGRRRRALWPAPG